MHWSIHDLPDILYQFRPVDTGLPDQKVGLKDWPLYGNVLRDLPVLPDHISSSVEEWRVEAWMRLDKRIRLGDITDRMHPEFRISNNTLQQRSGRFRQDFHIISWYSGNKKSHDIEARINQELLARDINPALNTTRGLTPGLVDPALGEAGGRIPLPGNWGSVKISKSPKKRYAAPVRAPQQVRNTAPQNMPPPVGSHARVGANDITRRPMDTTSPFLTPPYKRAAIGNARKSAAATPASADPAFNDDAFLQQYSAQQEVNGAQQFSTPISNRRPSFLHGTGSAAQVFAPYLSREDDNSHPTTTGIQQFSTPVPNGLPAVPATATHAFSSSPFDTPTTQRMQAISRRDQKALAGVAEKARNAMRQFSSPNPNTNLFPTRGDTQRSGNGTPATAANAFNNSSNSIHGSVSPQAANTSPSPASSASPQQNGTNGTHESVSPQAANIIPSPATSGSQQRERTDPMDISFLVNVADEVDGSQKLEIPIGDGSVPIDAIIEKLVHAKNEGYQQAGHLASFGKANQQNVTPETADNAANSTESPENNPVPAHANGNTEERVRIPLNVLQNLERHPPIPLPVNLHELDRDFISKWNSINRWALEFWALVKEKHRLRKEAAPECFSDELELDNDDKAIQLAIVRATLHLNTTHEALNRPEEQLAMALGDPGLPNDAPAEAFGDGLSMTFADFPPDMLVPLPGRSRTNVDATAAGSYMSHDGAGAESLLFGPPPQYVNVRDVCPVDNSALNVPSPSSDEFDAFVAQALSEFNSSY